MIETEREEEFDVNDGFVKAIRLMALTCLLFTVIICGLLYALKSFETKTTVNPKPDNERSMNTTVVDMKREVLSRKIY